MSQDKAHPTPPAVPSDEERAAFEATYQRDASDPSSAELLDPFVAGFRAAVASTSPAVPSEREQQVRKALRGLLSALAGRRPLGLALDAAEAALATPPSLPAAQAVEEAKGARQVVEVYDKLHEGKFGQHWLWAVIEQIAAGVPEDEAMRAFGYYEKQDAAIDEGMKAGTAADQALAAASQGDRGKT